MELYISSTDKLDVKRIARLLRKHVKCFQVSKNISVYNGKLEYGVKISLIEGVTEENFKKRVWRRLIKKVKIKCAFVSGPYYKGCVTNWPHVFVKSNCPSS